MASLRCSLWLRHLKFLQCSKTTHSLIRSSDAKDVRYLSWERKVTHLCKSKSRINSRKQILYLQELYRRRLKAGPEPERHPSVWGCWNHDTEIYAFGQRFGEEFDESILKRAFVQRSYAEKEETKRKELGIQLEEVPLDLKDNQELADKGYQLASRYIKAYLRYSYPQMFEEGICAIHDYLMSDKMLFHIGSGLGIKDIIMSAEYPPEEQDYIKTFLAVIGALLESQDAKRAEMFVQDIVIPQLIGKDINEMWDFVNPVGLLSAVLASQGRGEPESRLLWSSASETIMSLYHVGIYSDRQLIGKSPGETVNIAEEMAARDALKNILRTSDNRPPLKMGEKAYNLELDYDKKNPSVAEFVR